MLPELTGLPLEAAERILREAGIAYTLRKTASPYHHAPVQGTIDQNYAVRFEQGELTYASFPVLIKTDTPREGNE